MKSPRILIIRLGAIGDVINHLPLLNRLRKGFPESFIAWAVEPRAFPIIEGHPSLDEIIIFPRKEPWKIPKFIAQIRKHRFDWVLDTQRILKSGLLSFLSGGERRIGFDRARCKEGNWLFNNETIPPNRNPGVMLDQFLEFADHLKAPPGPVEWKIAIPAEIERWGDRVVQHLPPPRIALNIGATKPANRWRPERYALLGKELAEELHGSILLTGGRDDLTAIAKIDTILPSPPFHDFVGKTTLKQTAALLKRCDLVISGDTGPLHLAVAMGTPVIGIYGAADPDRTGPYGNQKWIVRKDLPCSPCGRRKCPLKTLACLEELPVREVLEKVRNFTKTLH